MFTFHCIAKMAAKTKRNMSLQIDAPEKNNLCTHPDQVLLYKVR